MPAVVLLLTVLFGAPAQGACTAIDLDVQTLREAIAGIRDRAGPGYDIDATTNQPRFVAEFLFALADRVQAQGQRSFRVLPQRYFEAWQLATGKTAEQAPVGMKRVLEFDQRFVVEIDPTLTLRLPSGLELKRALAVRVGWPVQSNGADSYRYIDTAAEPDVLLQQARDIRYLLLDFGDFVAYEQVDGISGKPTSGGLGALFLVLGLADLRSSRLAISEDGLQVNRTRVAKLFTFTAVALVRPDGVATRDLPRDRPDLIALAERLAVDYEVDAPTRWPELCD